VSRQTDQYGQNIRAIVVTSGSVSTLAGKLGVTLPFSDGVGTEATFFEPAGVALNSACTLALVVSGEVYMKLTDVSHSRPFCFVD
jgi:hypothetical protein